MNATYQLLYKLSQGTLEFTNSPLFGPTEMLSTEQCIHCMNDPQKWVCSADGIAWCCEVGDIHPYCSCFGNSLEDLMYCPSNQTNCGTIDIRFTENSAKNITVQSRTFNTLCTYTIESDYDGVVDVYAGNQITVIDPEDMTTECLNTPCNLTISVYDDNQVYVVSMYAQSNFTAMFTPAESSMIPKGIQAWLFITYICLAGAIVVFSFLAVWIVCKLRRARMSSSRSYG